ncbi:MAG: mechanosensitive ion channel family protein [Firmicutes bacterium]|nr:mechanosensitive ion channel family protein [Bacillota bacterium]
MFKKRSKQFKIAYWSIVAVLVVLFFTAGTISYAIFGDVAFTRALQGSTLDITNIGNFFSNNMERVISVLSTLFIVFLVIKFFHIVIRLMSLKASNRRKTILALVYSFIKYTGIIIMFFALLALVMEDVGTLLAGAGVLVIIIGFGMQSMLADIIAGLFIIFENTFEVGDIVTFDNFRGEVVYIGIRTTKFKGIDGNIHVVNNSEMRRLVNMTQDNSVAICDVTIEYSENLEKIEKLIENHLPTLPAKLEQIVEQPAYIGPAEFNDRGITLRIIAKCHESNRMMLTRALNREMKILFDKHKITFAVPHIKIDGKVK